MSAKELVEACENNLFPSTATVTRFGLDGNKPVETFACYRSAILDGGVTVGDIEDNYNDLSNFILEKALECYSSVLDGEGIYVSTLDPHSECPNCRMCTIHDDDMCINCGTHLKV